MWKEDVALGSNLNKTKSVAKAVNALVLSSLEVEYANKLRPHEHELPALYLSGRTDYTMGAYESQYMEFHGGFMHSKLIYTATLSSINSDGFDGWYNPVDRLLGCIVVRGTSIMLFYSVQWDGSPGGKVGTILRHTEACLTCYEPDFFLRPFHHIPLKFRRTVLNVRRPTVPCPSPSVP